MTTLSIKIIGCLGLLLACAACSSQQQASIQWDGGSDTTPSSYSKVSTLGPSSGIF